MLLYNCPLKDLPSSLGLCSVDASRDCRMHTARTDGAVSDDGLVSVERSALEGAFLGNAIAGVFSGQVTRTEVTYGREGGCDTTKVMVVE